MRVRKIWIVTEFYYPDENATGFLLTSLAKGLSDTQNVGVICRRPTWFSKKEIPRNAGSIPKVERVWATNFNKENLLLRIVNNFVLSLTISIRLLFKVRSHDTVLVVTNPPTLPYAAAAISRMKGARCIILVYDVYPEVLVAAGLFRADHPLVKLLHLMTAFLFHLVDAIIVLGHDMKNLVAQRYRGTERILHIIPNWADTENIVPTIREDNGFLIQNGIAEKFVVGYVGNIGRTHDIESLVKTAQLLSDSHDIHFLFIGGGAKRRWLDEYVTRNDLKNVTILPYFDRSRQSEVHNACDLSIISFVPGMAGVSVPSRMYNMMAAGKPILAVTDAWSELATVVREENIGWVISSRNPSDIAECIVRAKQQPEVLLEMGQRARKAVVRDYSFNQTLRRYESLVSELEGRSS